jgi:hypothetical protein
MEEAMTEDEDANDPRVVGGECEEKLVDSTEEAEEETRDGEDDDEDEDEDEEGEENEGDDEWLATE